MKKRIYKAAYFALGIFIVSFMTATIVGVKPMVVVSGSMEPAVRTGSLCLVNVKADFDKVEEDDIIAFKMGEALITHRVIAVADGGFETKGDANEAKDFAKVTNENYVGKNLCAVPYLGYAVFFVKKYYYIFLMILLIWLFWDYTIGKEDTR